MPQIDGVALRRVVALSGASMTDAELRNIVDLLKAAGRTHIPVPISIWREHMAATIKKASLKTDAKGKTTIKVPDATPAHFKQAKRAKAGRKVAGLVKNREAKR